MNQVVLDQYNIVFIIVRDSDRKRIDVASDLLPVTGFFSKLYPDYVMEELIPAINQAIAGLPFDSDGGGVYNFLEIGMPHSGFKDFNNVGSQLLTVDLKEILLSYVEWIKTNSLEEYI